MDVANLTLQGYILGFFPKFRKGRDARDCKPEDTHAAIPNEAPGWSLLWSEQPETLSQNFHFSWQQLDRAASSSEGAPPREPGVPVPDSTPLLPAHQGLGSSNIYFPYNLER